MAMPSSCFNDMLGFLEWLETDWNLEASMKVHIQNVKLKARFLKVFFSCAGKWYIDDKNLQVLLRQIEIVFLSADQDLQLLWLDLMQNLSKNDWSLPGTLHHLISSVLQKFHLIRPLIQEVYAIVSKSQRFVDALSDYLKDLRVNCKAHSTVNLEIEALEKNLRYLEYFFGLMKNWCPDHEKLSDVLIHSEAVADNLIFLLYLCFDENKMDEHMINEMKLQISHLQQKIKLVQPDVRDIYVKAVKTLNSLQQSFFSVNGLILGFIDSVLGNIMELLDAEVSFPTSLKNPINALQVELKIQSDYLMDPSAHQYSTSHPEVTNLIFNIKIVICKAACVIYSCFDIDITEDMAKKLHLEVSDLLQEFKVIKEKARVIYDEIVPNIFRSNFPTTDELGFINFMIQNLKDQLLNSKVDLLQHQIETIHGELLSVRGDFTEIAEHPREHQELKGPWTRFKDIVYQTEHVIDSFIIGDKPLWFYKLGLFDVIEEIKLIRLEVNDIKDKKTDDTAYIGVSSESHLGKIDVFPGPKYEAANEANNISDYVELFKDEADRITDQLKDDRQNLQILSIVGMPGIGKTTLANAIYEDPSVLKCFHVHARCCVTQEYQKGRLLLEILQKVSGKTYQGNGMSDDDLAHKLRQNLLGKKYLIFFDDVWDILPWKDMSTTFPDNKGSKIISTSRFHSNASETNTNGFTYTLNAIPESKSWKLLQVKLFKKESCPPNLIGVGREIAANCKGLTIAVDLIAGLLKTKERKEAGWVQVLKSLRTYLKNQQEQYMGILELSYNHLPNHLKPCFLYFGAFLEDEEVPTSELSRLWIAEGFVQLQKHDKRSLEDAAEKYLNDLIARSLIIESKRGTLGGIKASHIHDLLRDFALTKAKEECFLRQTKFRGKLLHPGANSVNETYRLNIYSGCKNFAPSNTSFCPRVRSLVLYSYALSDVILNISCHFKLLRVLKLSARCKRNDKIVFKLVHLRFLSLTLSLDLFHMVGMPFSGKDLIPSEIGNLLNLETFLLRHSVIGLPNFNLPKTFWNLSRLRHFKIFHSSYTLSEYKLEKSLKFDNLQTLSTPLICYGNNTDMIMQGLPNLRKLSCIFLDSWDESSKCNRFPVLDFLTRLESLKVAYGGELRHPCKFNFPANIKKLTLSKFHLPWSEISVVGKLHNLEVLKLLRGAFVGRTWDMKEGEFVKLKFLKLYSLNIEQWNTDEDYLPCLETLVLYNCNRLKEVPLSLGNIPTMQRLQLQDYSLSAGTSAGVIKEMQEGMGNDQFVLTLSNSFSFYTDGNIVY